MSPSLIPRSRESFSLPCLPYRPSRLQFGVYTDFKIELFPVHSPLLGESLLVSFPPLSYMLKFSGSSYLISGQWLKGFLVAAAPKGGAAWPNVTTNVAATRLGPQSARGRANAGVFESPLEKGFPTTPRVPPGLLSRCREWGAGAGLSRGRRASTSETIDLQATRA